MSKYPSSKVVSFAKKSITCYCIAVLMLLQPAIAQHRQVNSSLSSGAAIAPTAILQFNAKLNAGFITLDWNTPVNITIQEIQLQKSVDGKVFLPINTLQSSTILESNGIYQYKDQVLADKKETVYYRLRIREENGAESFSPVRVINLDATLEMVEMKIPTIVDGGSVQFTIPAEWTNQKVVVEIYNQEGELVRRITEPAAPALLVVEMNDLQAGTYLLRTKTATQLALNYVVNTGSL